MDYNGPMEPILKLSPTAACAALHSSAQGLTSAEAALRHKQNGYNEISKAHERGAFLSSIYRATNPLVAILLIAAAVSAFTQNEVNAIIIVTMVIMSVVLDFYQTHRSMLAAKRLQAQVATRAMVLRDGQWIQVPLRELVPGDIIQLEAGDLVPADALLLESKDLHVQQAALTGESLPTEKEASNTGSQATTPAEASNAVFLGSSIVSGDATALVFAIGRETQVGQIALSLSRTSPPTDFDKGISRFGFLIMKTVVFLVLFTFIVCILMRHNALEALLFSVALAVGLTPEFLPMITTVTLATAAVRMSHKKVIVKNLASIQNFGSIDTLCCDKTGTLTRGEMTLEQHVDPLGTDSDAVLLLGYLNSLFETGIKNPINTALLTPSRANPLDIAILKHDHPDVKSYRKIDEIPFDFERRRASVVVEKSGVKTLITKGAPEQIMKICTYYEINGQSQVLSEDIFAKCQALFNHYSTQGYRVIAVAYRVVPEQSAYRVDEEHDLVLAGFLCFIDPPLEDAGAMIQSLQTAGVIIKIISGDNELVANHVCRAVGLDPGKIILGEQVDHMTDTALGQVAEQARIFARVTPGQKQRIILALRARGHVVGYIGDGINDAPSLHSADVGISVANAVDVAREAADIILLENHLDVLLNGIIEGRKSFGNVMKYLMMGTSSNFGNMLSMALSLAFLPFLPMLPAQILLNNLLYDIAQVTIPTDHVDSSFTQKPKHWNIDIIKRFMFYIGPISSLFDFLTFFVMLKVFHATESLFQTGWFVESLATQTLVIFIIRTAKNPFKSRPSLPLTLTVFAVVVFSIWLPFSPLASYLGFVPLPFAYFLFLTGATLSYLFLVQIIKNKLMWRWL